MINLADISSLIKFDEREHTYTRVSDGKILQGVTTMLKKVGLSANYDGIPEQTLMLAADRGHCVHALCDKADDDNCHVDEIDEREIYDDLTEKGIIKYLEAPYGKDLANAYYDLRESLGLIPIAYEYLVSDGENIASCIDLVLTTEKLAKENKVILADIKTTSSIHESLAWQLSTYRDLFEAQNPDIKVEKLMGVWLPKPYYGQPKIFDSASKSTEDVRRMINCFVSGEVFVDDTNIVSSDGSTGLIPQQNEIIDILRSMDVLKKKEAQLKENLLLWMSENGHKKFENDNIIITRVLAGTTEKFDSSSFKKENPGLYAKYVKTTETKESIRIKIK